MGGRREGREEDEEEEEEEEEEGERSVWSASRRAIRNSWASCCS